LGPNTLSCDEIFIALEYKALLSKHKVDLKMWEDGVKKEYDLEQKAKAILAQGKPISKILSDDLRILIRWKEGGKDKGKDMKLGDRREHWEGNKDIPSPDVVLPPEPEKPAIPSIRNTELGRNVYNKVKAALACGDNLQNEDLGKLTQELNIMCEQRGIITT
jgi:hypothetical protein